METTLAVSEETHGRRTAHCQLWLTVLRCRGFRFLDKNLHLGLFSMIPRESTSLGLPQVFVICLVTFSTILPERIGGSLCRSIVLDANDVFAGCSEFCHPGIRGLTIGRGGRYTGRQLAIHDGLDGNANCL